MLQRHTIEKLHGNKRLAIFLANAEDVVRDQQALERFGEKRRPRRP